MDGGNILPSSILDCKAPEGAEKKVKRRRRARDEGEEGRKRRLSEEQAEFLEKSFRNERKLESGRKVQLATEAGLEPKQVAVWFQNRRARWKSKQLEGEYNRLKSMHDAALVDNCRLQSEVMTLKQQLLEAQKEVESLSGLLNRSSGGAGGDGGSVERGGNPSMSYSMDANTFYGELWPKGEELGFMDEYGAYANMLEWFNLYGM